MRPTRARPSRSRSRSWPHEREVCAGGRGGQPVRRSEETVMALTPRERIRLALDHREPDRIPIDLGGTFATSITKAAYVPLREHLGLPTRGRPHLGRDPAAAVPGRGPARAVPGRHPDRPAAADTRRPRRGPRRGRVLGEVRPLGHQVADAQGRRALLRPGRGPDQGVHDGRARRVPLARARPAGVLRDAGRGGEAPR